MSETSHWPFDGDAGAGNSRVSAHPSEAEIKRAHLADQAALRRMMRHDRLIKGGRAHTKKSGLS
jgi:hypothetical protein